MTETTDLAAVYARRDELDRQLRGVSARIDAVEDAAARGFLNGEALRWGPEMERLTQKRQRLLDELRVARRAIAIARGQRDCPGIAED